MKSLALCFLILAISYSCFATNDTELGTIIFANVLYRHGDRTPIEPYPTDPWGHESLWPVPFGQLTNLGKHQHLLLGRWLRNRYNHLLSPEYSLYDIYVRSTDVDRTLMSAEANLAGLYPPQGDQVWDTLKWMPIPVHTLPQAEDNVLGGKKFCPKYKYEMHRVLNSPKMKKIIADNQELLNYLTEMTGRKIDSLEQLEYVYNILRIEEIYNRTLPKWTDSVYPNKLKPLADLSFTVPAYNKVLQRFKMGLLVKEMVSHMQQKARKALVPDRKLWMYSAHDETVANFLMTLNLFEPHCPPYTAAVLVELRETANQQKIVTVSYKNSTGEPTLMTLPGCIQACPLDQFVRLFADVIPEDWDRECLLTWDNYGHDFSISSVLSIMMSTVFLLIVVILLIVAYVIWHFNRQRKQYYTRIETIPI